MLANFRPFSEDEVRNNAPQVVSCNEYQREVSVSQSIAGGKHVDRVFSFDKVDFIRMFSCIITFPLFINLFILKFLLFSDFYFAMLVYIFVFILKLL